MRAVTGSSLAPAVGDKTPAHRSEDLRMLRGKQVALRPVDQRDLELITRWWNEPDFREGAASRWPARAQEIEERLTRKIRYDKEAHFLICLTEGAGTERETPVGDISFSMPFKLPVFRCYEIGFSVHPDFRRRGYATQAARLLIDRLFNAHPVQRVQAHCRVGNEPSRRVLEAAGMTQEGTMRSAVFLDGQYVDVCFYSILRPEWGDTSTYAERYGGL